MTAAEMVAKFRHWVAVAPTDSYADGFLTLRWRDIEAAADLIETMADELEGAHHDLEVLRHELAQR